MGRIIPYNTQKNVQKRKFVWRPEWVQSFESPWGIIEKFRYANQLIETDVFEIFAGCSGHNPWISHYKSLLTLTAINGGVSKDILGYDLRGLTQGFLRWILGTLNQNPEHSYIRKDLNYCPECIQEGFHSLFHQITLLSKCPYHDSPLVDRCPNCKRKIPYEISFSWSQGPFKCKCGYSFLDPSLEHNFVKQWYNRPQSRYVLPELVDWINLNSNNNKIRSIFYNNASRYNEDLLKLLVITLNKTKYFECHKNIIESQYSVPKRKTLITNKNAGSCNTRELNTELSHCANDAFKIINRHIRKRVLRHHDKCISNLINSVDRNNPCSLAYAYVMWRRDIEGLQHYWQVTNNWKPDKRRHNYCYEFLRQYKCFDFIDNLIFIEPEQNLDQIKWLFSKLATLTIYYHFYKWVEVGKEYANKNLFYIRLSLDNIDLPFHITTIPKSAIDPTKFFRWPLQINHNLNQKCNCLKKC